MADPVTRVAVYIDFDNIVISRYDQLHGRGQFQRDKFRGFDRAGQPADPEIAEKFRQATVDVGAVIDFASSFGTLVLTRAYADWSVLVNADYRGQLVSRAVDLVQLFPAAAYAKNGADIRLAVDAVEDMFRLPDLTHVVIVAGDSDYIALAQRCRRLGRYVVGIGVAGSTSRSLAAACDELVTYDALPGISTTSSNTTSSNTTSSNTTSSNTTQSNTTQSGRRARQTAASGGNGRAAARAEPTTEPVSTSPEPAPPGTAPPGTAPPGTVSPGTVSPGPTSPGTAPAFTSGALPMVSVPTTARAPENDSSKPASGLQPGFSRPAFSDPNSAGHASDWQSEAHRRDAERLEALRIEAHRIEADRTEADRTEADRTDADWDAELARIDRSGAQSHPNSTDLDAEDPQSVATRLLKRALRLGQEKDDADWLHSSAVKNQMKRMDPAFNEKGLGYRSFTEFVKSREDVAELDESSSVRLIRLLPGSTG